VSASVYRRVISSLTYIVPKAPASQTRGGHILNHRRWRRAPGLPAFDLEAQSVQLSHLEEGLELDHLVSGPEER